MYGRKRSPAPILVLAGGGRGASGGVGEYVGATAEAFTAKGAAGVGAGVSRNNAAVHKHQGAPRVRVRCVGRVEA